MDRRGAWCLDAELLVFVLSIVPVGPPLIWGPAAIWLYSNGDPGMAAFLVLWGTLAVSSVDNFLKPVLIARGSSLPLALIFLGVFGGVIAFGFLGSILGPILLAVGLSMLQAWLRNPNLVRKFQVRTKRSKTPFRHKTKGNSLAEKEITTNKVEKYKIILIYQEVEVTQPLFSCCFVTRCHAEWLT